LEKEEKKKKKFLGAFIQRMPGGMRHELDVGSAERTEQQKSIDRVEADKSGQAIFDASPKGRRNIWVGWLIKSEKGEIKKNRLQRADATGPILL